LYWHTHKIDLSMSYL